MMHAGLPFSNCGKSQPGWFGSFHSDQKEMRGMTTCSQSPSGKRMPHSRRLSSTAWTAAAGPFVHRNYLEALNPHALQSKRIGVWRGGGDVADVNAVTTYPIAVLKHAKNPDLAGAFVDYVLSATGKKVLSVAGFGPP